MNKNSSPRKEAQKRHSSTRGSIAKHRKRYHPHDSEVELNSIEPSSDTATRRVAVIIVGVILTILTGSGVALMFAKPSEAAKDVWLIIGPLIATGMSTLGYVLGGRRPTK
jgi:hypothetical protein